MTQAEKRNILIVDDDRDTAKFLSMLLPVDKFETTITTSASKAIALMKEKHFPVILADISLGGPDGLTLIPYTKQSALPSVIVFVTGHASLDTAVKAISAGAFEYICKTDDMREMETDLLQVVDRALQHLATLENTTPAVPETFASGEKSIVGKAPSMVKLYRTIAKAALSKGNVLITGESGTGKELVAHAIHDNGPWSNQPFVTVNCSALTETLLESELFGHVKGSFTGAIANKKGLFEEANGGTIFLDEIGDVSPLLQVKLLRAIQEGEIKPVGASENRTVHVRVIAATHRNLDNLMKEGIFREDLYYRLKVFLLDVPPLRERKQDIPELVTYFVRRIGKDSHPPVDTVSPEALELLLHYPWPGNIRELENSIERAAGMANSNVLYPEDFPGEIVNYEAPEASIPQAAVATTMPMEGQSLHDMESVHIARTLEMVRYNKSRAAEILGIDRGTLYRKAIQYGIPLKPPRGEDKASPAKDSSSL